jgi:hypothetical protein
VQHWRLAAVKENAAAGIERGEEMIGPWHLLPPGLRIHKDRLLELSDLFDGDFDLFGF